MPATDAAVARLTASMEALTPVIQSLNEEVRSGREKTTEVLIQLQGLSTTLTGVKTDLDNLTKVVSTGNGQPSLVHRVTTLETRQQGVMGDITDLKVKLDTFANAKMLTKGQIIAGVIGMITPWNWPQNQICAKVGPALAAGCTMVLKPSELAPLACLRLADLESNVVLAGIVELAEHLPRLRLAELTSEREAGFKINKRRRENPGVPSLLHFAQVHGAVAVAPHQGHGEPPHLHQIVRLKIFLREEASAVYCYGGLVFVKGGLQELRDRKPGMMTLISLAITVAFVFSAYVGVDVANHSVSGSTVVPFRARRPASTARVVVSSS